jgi:hypothetical protein
MAQREAINAPRQAATSTPRDESRSPPEAESTNVPDEEVASSPEESRRAHPAIGNDKCTQHTMDVKCTYKYSFRTRYRMTPTNGYREANGYSTDAAYRDGTEKSTKNAPKLSSE